MDDRPPRVAWDMWKRFLLATTIVVALTAAATATAVLQTVSGVAHNLSLGGAPIKSPALTADQAGAPQTIMVIGSDKRAGSRVLVDRTSPPHTDTILLIRMDPYAGQTSVLSVPRDLLVSFTDLRGGYYPGAKINSAYSYGGVTLALRVVKRTLGITINHVVDLNFRAFRQVVTAIGCVYIDVDKRYYNLNTGTIATNFASIDIRPGYQKLCGQQALDYARYRHTDSDFVRVARQQDFIRQVKEQVGAQGLLDNYGEITKSIGRSIRTDIRGTTAVLRLLKLAAFSLSRPVRQVKFRANPDAKINGGSYVVATPEQVAATVRDFLHPGSPVATPVRRIVVVRGRGRHRRRTHVSPSASSLGLYATSAYERSQAKSGMASVRRRVHLYLPTLKTGPAVLNDVRAYALRDEHGHIRLGYRADWRQSSLGGYYGFEGMDWPDPPLFAHARAQWISGRTYLIVDDGSHIHDIGWRERGRLYWVSNTLLEDLSNAQMIALAQSAHTLR